MAKKTTRSKDVKTTHKQPATKPIRLAITPEDHKRLDQCARQRGLTKASYVRMAILALIRKDEEGGY
jgi:predicted DNA-binding protein